MGRRRGRLRFARTTTKGGTYRRPSRQRAWGHLVLRTPRPRRARPRSLRTPLCFAERLGSRASETARTAVSHGEDSPRPARPSFFLASALTRSWLERLLLHPHPTPPKKSLERAGACEPHQDLPPGPAGAEPELRVELERRVVSAGGGGRDHPGVRDPSRQGPHQVLWQRPAGHQEGGRTGQR